MGLLGSSDPVAQQEKLLHKEEKREEQSIKHAIKEISKAEKEQASAAKAEQHSHSTLEKAVKTEHKLGEKLNKITHEHDSAVADQNAAQNKLQSKEQAHQHATQVLQEKKAKLDQLQSNHHQSDAERQAKLDSLHHTSTPAPAGTALDKEYAQQGYSSTGATQAPVGQAVPQQQGGLAGNYAAQDPAAGQAFVSQGQPGVGGPTQAGQRF